MDNKIIPNSNNWWLCKNYAYFSAVAVNALFGVDFNCRKCELISLIPNDKLISYKLFSNCLEYNGIIFCLPGLGEYIWYYDRNNNMWEKITIKHKKELRMCENYLRKNYGMVWLSEYGGRKIFQINLNKKIVEKEYHIPDTIMGFTGECILVDEKIYGVCKNRICCIDACDGSVAIYNIPKIKEDLYTICYDGAKFWLSGHGGEIYVWNSGSDNVKIIADFSQQLDGYRFDLYPLFVNSIFLGKYIWYIPLQMRDIFYINRETYQIHVLKMENEQESEEERNCRPSHMIKYVVEYIREDRYIGIYSFKFRSIFEVDTDEIQVDYKDYLLDEKAIQAIAQKYFKDKKVLWEGNSMDQEVFSMLLDGKSKNDDTIFNNIGECIYQVLV